MRNKKIIYAITLIFIFSIFVSGCASSPDKGFETAPQENENSYREEFDLDNAVTEDKVDSEESMEPDKVITTVSISMQTKEFMDTTDKLNTLIKKHKGYIEQSNISYNNYVYSTRLKYSDYSIRIPRENLDLFIEEVKEIGNIISENKSKVDITKQYRDTESRLKVLETKEERLLSLLEKAEKMEDIIALENQLSNIIYEKENLTANLMDMDDKVDYSTVNFQLEEVAKLTSSGNVKTPFLDKIKNAFNDSIYFFTHNIENLFISLVYFLPYLLIILIIVYILLRFLRKRKNKLPKDLD